jgi:biopolymer transport protein ExbD
MSKFKKKKNETPQISTSSLPDIVFMLLFFFMVSTTVRNDTVLVEQKIPTATQLQKLEKKSVVSFLYIGRPKNEQFGTEPRIQANDVFIEPRAIPRFVEMERGALPERDKDAFTVSLKVSSEARMGIVTDVKEQLREVEARNINYSVNKVADITQ